MSSDPVLREQVKALLQNVINQRMYGQGGGGRTKWQKFLKKKEFEPCYDKYKKPKQRAKKKGKGMMPVGGYGYGGYGYGGDMYDGLYGNALVGGYPIGGYAVGGKNPRKQAGGKKAAKNSCWINYVKKFAASHDLSYAEALKKARPSYRKQYGSGLADLY